ncbi:DNA-binding protein [Bacteroidia bacterium]|nr:DNA-binding protein [Bacteroidia bacterium]
MEIQLVQIQSKILEIRSHQVMIDRDLAALYGVETKQLNQAVRRNIERFAGDDFMFELSIQEWKILRSQFVTSSWGGSRYQPFAFTELGVAMLSSVLNSPKAIEMNRNIMRAFVGIRQFLSNPLVDRVTIIEHDFKKLITNLEDVFTDYNDINEDTRTQLELLSKSVAELQVHKKIFDKPRTPIGFRPNHES